MMLSGIISYNADTQRFKVKRCTHGRHYLGVFGKSMQTIKGDKYGAQRIKTKKGKARKGIGGHVKQ